MSAYDPEPTLRLGADLSGLQSDRTGVRAHSVVGIVWLAFNGAAAPALHSVQGCGPAWRREGSLYHGRSSKTDQQK